MAIKREYYPIEDAARMLGCETNDLIHLGAIGKLNVWGQFTAPVAVSACPVLPSGYPDFETWYETAVDEVETEFLGFADLVLLGAGYMREVEANHSGPLIKDLPRPDMVRLTADSTEVFFIHPEEVCRVGKLIIKTADIERLTLDPAEPAEASASEKPQAHTERVKMLAVILGMALDAYGYTPGANKNAATGGNHGSIQAALEKHGLTVDQDTIRKYLTEAATLNPGAKPHKTRPETDSVNFQTDSAIGGQTLY